MNRYARNIYEKLTMRCPNDGCTETFPWTQQVQHDLQCIFAPKIECEHCKESLHPKVLEEHHRVQCVMLPVMCKVAGCGQMVARIQMQEHCATEHPQEQSIQSESVDQLIEAESRDRQRSIALHLQLLIHSVNCNGCASNNCGKMKVCGMISYYINIVL
jgi:hypothetical protein